MKLTDTQLILLTDAAKRPDSTIVLPARLKGGAGVKVVDRLLKTNPIEERPTGGSLPEWRRGDDGAPLALVITAAGLKAIKC